MIWFKVDDGFFSHPKVVGLPAAAVALWVRAGAYCGRELTDGYVASGVLPMLGARPRDAAALVAAGLWEVDRDGWRFHDWGEHQPSAAKVRHNRASEAERLRQIRAAAKAANAGRAADRTDVRTGVPEPYGNDPVPVPVPVPGGEDSLPSLPPVRGETHLPADWQPSEKHRALAEELKVDLTSTAARFQNHAKTWGRTAKDWDLAFTAWLKRAPAMPRDPALDIEGNDWLRKNRS